MNDKRTLRLRRDVLAELANDELTAVAGADAAAAEGDTLTRCATCQIVSCVVRCIPQPQTLAC